MANSHGLFSTPMEAVDFQKLLGIAVQESFPRTIKPGVGGVAPIHASNTAMVCIEYQNEFATEGGKMHPAVKECMEKTKMLDNSVALVHERCVG